MRRFAKEGLSSASQTALARTTAMRRQRVRGSVLVLQVLPKPLLPNVPGQAQLRFKLALSTLFRPFPSRRSSPSGAAIVFQYQNGTIQLSLCPNFFLSIPSRPTGGSPICQGLPPLQIIPSLASFWGPKVQDQNDLHMFQNYPCFLLPWEHVFQRGKRQGSDWSLWKRGIGAGRAL